METTNNSNKEVITNPTSTHNLSVDSCVKAVSQSLLIGRKALLTEMSVCLAIFSQAHSTDQTMKAVVVEVYERAGYDCVSTNTRHYKTVNRRVNAAAALYEKLGAEVISGFIGDTKDGKLIDAIAKGLSEHKFDCLDDVLDFAGKESNRTRKVGEKAEKVEKKTKVSKKEEVAVPMYKFNVERVHVELPMSMSATGMVRLAAKILAVARDKEQAELKAIQAEGGGSISAGEPKVIH